MSSKNASVGGNKTGQGATGELLNSFLVLFQLFYKNKIKVEKLIKPRVKALSTHWAGHLKCER